MTNRRTNWYELAVARRVDHVDLQGSTKGMLPSGYCTRTCVYDTGRCRRAEVRRTSVGLNVSKALDVGARVARVGAGGVRGEIHYALLPSTSNRRQLQPSCTPTVTFSLFSLSLSLYLSWFLSRSLSRPLRTHKLRVHPHRVRAEVEIKCCCRDGLASLDREGVKARRKTVSSK